jgi:hypothetical protein
MNDLEGRILAVLRERAEREVDVMSLTAGAVGAGLRHRRHRRVGHVAAGMAVLAVVAAAVAVVPRWLPHGSRGDSTPAASASPSDRPAPVQLVYQPPAYDPVAKTYASVPTPPWDSTAPTAVQDPATVGTAGLVHFSFAPEADLSRIGTAIYQTGPVWGMERLRIFGDAFSLEFELSRTRPGTGPTHPAFFDGTKSRPVTMGPLTGMYHYFETCDGCSPGTQSGVGTLVWQPTPGLWALLNTGGGQNRAVQIASALRLDRTYRAVVPYRLTAAPAGSTLQNDVLTFQGGTVSSTSYVGATTENSVTVSVVSRVAGVDGVLPAQRPGVSRESTTVNGKPAVISTGPYCAADDQSPHCAQVTVPQVVVAIDFGETVVTVSNWGNIERAAILDTAAALVNLYGDDLATWPTSPIS